MCAGELQDYKKAKAHVDELQTKKAMYQTWKIDIFIDDTCFALCVMNIPQSAAYKKGVFEWSVDALKVYHKGLPDLEHIGSVHLASFPTPEAAFGSIEHIRTYIQHRYNFDLEIEKEIHYEF